MRADTLHGEVGGRLERWESRVLWASVKFGVHQLEARLQVLEKLQTGLHVQCRPRAVLQEATASGWTPNIVLAALLSTR